MTKAPPAPLPQQPAPASAPAPAPTPPRPDFITDILPLPSAAAATVGYATDIEGNLDYWHRYISLSQVLFRPAAPDASAAADAATGDSGSGGQAGAAGETWRVSPGSSLPPLQLRDHCHFVYGGDVCDRGSGDIRICRDLLSLKQRYPERVHLIVGNRDINKVRPLLLPSFLCPSSLLPPPSSLLNHIRYFCPPETHTFILCYIYIHIFPSRLISLHTPPLLFQQQHQKNTTPTLCKRCA